MGHYWSEMESRANLDARDKHNREVERLRNLTRKMPIGDFTVEELGALMRLWGLLYNAAGTLAPRDYDLKTLRVAVSRGVTRSTDENGMV